RERRQDEADLRDHGSRPGGATPVAGGARRIPTFSRPRTNEVHLSRRDASGHHKAAPRGPPLSLRLASRRVSRAAQASRRSNSSATTQASGRPQRRRSRARGRAQSLCAPGQRRASATRDRLGRRRVVVVEPLRRATTDPTRRTPRGRLMRFQVGTDVGGTFTDLWVVSDAGRSEVVKTPTTPDIIGGIIDAFAIAADRFGVTVAEFSAGRERIGHGTTAGLNALLTGDLAPAGLIVTQGFADTLEIGRLKRQVAGLSELEIGDYLQRGRFEPVIPRTRIIGVPERIDRTGKVLLPLDEDATRNAVRRLLATGVEAIGVCTLWSIVRPDHELQIGRIIEEEAPGVFVCLSHESAPGLGEYARKSTTAVNASLAPVTSRYFSQLDAAFSAEGARTPVHVMTSTGGSLGTTEVTNVPAAALLSGPAAAVVSSQQMAAALGFDRVLTIDMGGTSFDVGTIIDGVPLMRSEVTIAGADVRFPA